MSRCARARPGWIALLAATAGLASQAGPGEAAPLPDPVVMMWQVAGDDPAADFGVLASLGVNTVQSFNLASRPQEYVERYLRAAEAAGMAVVPFVGRRKDQPGDPCTLPESGRRFVERYRASAAIAAWHSVDEPGLRGISRDCQAALYAAIKSLDPARPVLLSANFTSQQEYDEFFSEAAFDVLDLHKYVNLGVGSGQHALVRLFRENRRRSYRVIVTLRAFNSPAKFWRFDMREGSLFSQYEYFFEDAKLTRDIGFYGWNLAPNVGLTKLPAQRAALERLMREKVRARPGPGAGEREG
jgi:hypothetical protein